MRQRLFRERAAAPSFEREGRGASNRTGGNRRTTLLDPAEPGRRPGFPRGSSSMGDRTRTDSRARRPKRALPRSGSTTQPAEEPPARWRSRTTRLLRSADHRVAWSLHRQAMRYHPPGASAKGRHPAGRGRTWRTIGAQRSTLWQAAAGGKPRTGAFDLLISVG